jgi:HK97 family phage portal protein
MSFLSRAWTGAPEARTITKLESLPKWSEESVGGFGGGGDPMKLLAFFACVRILADSVSSLPLNAYKRKDGVRAPVKPMPQLIQSPYPDMTWRDWLWMMVQSLAVTGNAFGYVTARDKNMWPTAILPVHPDDVSIDNPKDGSADWTRPRYRIKGKLVDSADVFHIKRYPTAGCPVSLSPVALAATTIDLGFSAEQYGLRWFKDSSNPSGILTTEMDLDEGQVKRTLQSWMRAHRNRRIPAVLGNNMKWQSIKITPEESQFLETRSFQRHDIAMMFGIPLHKLGDTEKSTSFGSGIEHMSIGFVVDTLAPWLVCIEQAFDLILPRGQFSKFNVDALLRGDHKSRNEAYMIALQNGWLSVNEVRALEEREPIENGDIHLQPANFVELGTPPQEKGTAPTTSAKTGGKGN